MKQTSEGWTWIEPEEIEKSIHDCKGEKFEEIFYKVREIISHQLRNNIRHGIKGFIFRGDVGTGKTTLAKAVAKSLQKPLLFVDGSHIARRFYGQSERRITEVFEEAESKNGSIILIDDAESIFPDRDWVKGKAWHVAQNNVFFHMLDNMETDKTALIMTTNKYDLLDKAVKDRLYKIKFPHLSKGTLIEIAELKCREKGIEPNKIVNDIKENPGSYKTIRDVEKRVVEEYVKSLS